MTVAGIIVLLIAVAVVFANVYDFNKFKPRIEQAATDATGLPFSIRGDIGVKFLPGPAVSLKDVHYGKEDAKVLEAKEINASVEILPLLRRKVEVGKFEIVRPLINVVRDKNGRYNFEGKKKGAGAGAKEAAAAPAVLVGRIEISHGDLNYLDRASDAKVAVKDFGLSVRDLYLDRAAKDMAKAVSLTGSFDAATLRARGYTITDFEMRYRLADGVLSIGRIGMKLFGGEASGSAKIDLTKKRPETELVQEARGIDLAELAKQTSGKEIMTGKVAVKANLNMTGLSGREIKRSLSGDFSVRGGDLTLKGADIDSSVKNIEETGKLDFLDVGSIFVLGPFGPLITKSADVAVAYGTLGGGKESSIEELVFDWDIKDGIATTRDAAFSTQENRLAFDGQLDLVNDRFADLTAAVLDARGCATFKQTIIGPFSKPTVKKEGVVKSLLKPLGSILGTAKEAVGGSGECTTPFYKGEVEHPVP